MTERNLGTTKNLFQEYPLLLYKCIIMPVSKKKCVQYSFFLFVCLSFFRVRVSVDYLSVHLSLSFFFGKGVGIVKDI